MFRMYVLGRRWCVFDGDCCDESGKELHGEYIRVSCFECEEVMVGLC
jgi:hypothetical protein